MQDWEPQGSPPDTAGYAGREVALACQDTERHPCEGINSPLYHGGLYQARSATPLSPRNFSVYSACHQCCLPMEAGFSHRHCGDE
jgi:hypothetical protein